MESAPVVEESRTIVTTAEKQAKAKASGKAKKGQKKRAYRQKTKAVKN